MVEIDVDDIAEVNYFNESETVAEPERVQVIFKNGTEQIFEGADLPEVYRILNHWTPPMA
jgi:hypothetical protein